MPSAVAALCQRLHSPLQSEVALGAFTGAKPMNEHIAADHIHVRACAAAVEDGRILLVPHYDTDCGPAQWSLPGGRVSFGEPLRGAAARGFLEETGLRVAVGEVLDVTEALKPEGTWHSATIIFLGKSSAVPLRRNRGIGMARRYPAGSRQRNSRECPTIHGLR